MVKLYLMSISILLTVNTVFTQDITNKLGGDTASETYDVTDSNDNILLRVQGDGNVGIGTENPDELLHIDGNLRVDGTYEDKDGDAGTAGQILSSTGTGTDWVDAPSGSGTDSDWTISGDDMYSAVSGNVKIGSTSSSAKLTVENSGSTAIYGNQTSSTGSTYGIYGYSEAATGAGVKGSAGPTGANFGGHFTSSAMDGTGVYGSGHKFGGYFSSTTFPAGIGIYSEGSTYAGQFVGPVYANGSFQLSGTFLDKDGDAGTSGQILSSTTTETDWIDAPSGSGTTQVSEGGTGLTTIGGTNTIIYTTTADNISSIATGNNGVLVTNGSGVPSISSTLPANLNIATPRIGNSINDLNGNEIFSLTSASSAVNELNISNSSTGGGPTISAYGGDTNIDINIQTKGNGVTRLLGTSSTAGELRIYENTSSGFNFIGLKAGSIGSNLIFTLPVSDGSSGQVLTTNGAGVLSFSDPSSGGTSTYGEIFVSNSTTDLTVTTSNTWYKVTTFTDNGDANGVTANATSDDLTVGEAGTYMIMGSISFSGGNNAEVEFMVKKNNGTTDFTDIMLRRKLGTGGDVGSASISGIASFSENDTVELWFNNLTNTVDVRVVHANLSIVKL